MNRNILSLAGGALLLTVSGATSWAADVAPPPDWTCTCLTYGDSADYCSISGPIASITGPVLWFDTAEGAGQGTYVARHLPHRTIVNGVVTTADGDMAVTIVDWKTDHLDRGWLSAARVGLPDFTAECTGTVP